MAERAGHRPRAIVYIDGLNLYRSVLADSPTLKWLDPLKLCQVLIPTHEVCLVRYFTALVKPSTSGEKGLIRQQIYLRALRTQGRKISIHLGKMRTDSKVYLKLPSEFDDKGTPVKVRVQKVEEKGSDVALATYMVLDASQNKADVYVLLSNDSDFVPTLEVIDKELNQKLAWISTAKSRSNQLAKQNFLFIKEVRATALENSQFEDLLIDAQGDFHRPAEWR